MLREQLRKEIIGQDRVVAHIDAQKDCLSFDFVRLAAASWIMNLNIFPENTAL
jgi:hypothetical protein